MATKLEFVSYRQAARLLYMPCEDFYQLWVDGKVPDPILVKGQVRWRMRDLKQWAIG